MLSINYISCTLANFSLPLQQNMVRHTPKKNGETMDKIKTIDKRKILISMYPNHSVREIAKHIGCNESYLYKMAKKLGLRHNEETSKRIKNLMTGNLKKAYDKKTIEKRSRTRKRIIRMEKFRVMSGERQKTRLNVTKMPQKAYNAKYCLIRKYGYFSFEDERYTIGYDRDTKRVNEEYYRNKYGFKFEEDLTCQEA